MLAIAAAGGSAKADLEALNQSFPFQAVGAQIGEVVDELGRRTALVTRVAEGVDGEVTVSNEGGTARDLLEQATRQVDAVWWHDGVVLHVEREADLTTVLVDPAGLPIEFIEGEMAALDLADPRFPLQGSRDEAVVRVSGPAGYVEQVVALVTALVETRRVRVAPPTPEAGVFVPRVFRGRRLQ